MPNRRKKGKGKNAPSSSTGQSAQLSESSSLRDAMDGSETLTQDQIDFTKVPEGLDLNDGNATYNWLEHIDTNYETVGLDYQQCYSITRQNLQRAREALTKKNSQHGTRRNVHTSSTGQFQARERYISSASTSQSRPSERETEKISPASTSQSRPSRRETEKISPASTSQSRPSERVPSPTYTESTEQLPTSLSRLQISEEEILGAECLTEEFQEEHSSAEESEAQECIRNLKIEHSDRMVVAPGLPPKQPPGKKGKEVKLVSNLYPINIESCGNIYHYDVKIVDIKRSEVTELASLSVDKNVKRYRCLSTKINRRVIDRWLKTDANVKNSYAVYDGQKNLYTPKPLVLKFPYENKVEMEETSDGSVPIREVDKFKVIIKPVAKKNEDGTKRNSCAINLGPLYQLFAGKYKNVKNHDFYEIQESVMALETVFRHSPALKFIPIGRSFFNPSLGQINPLGGGIEIWFGYHQSVRLGQWKPLVNLNTTATIFFANTKLLEYFCGSMGTSVYGLQKLSVLNKEELKKLKKLSKELKGIRITVDYQRNKRKYTILEVVNKSATKLEFDTVENGVTRKTTIQEYLQRTYSKKLDYPYLPCVRVKPESKQIYFPIECCTVAENQHCKRELKSEEQREMIKYTAQPPQERFHKIEEVRRKRADYEHDAHLKQFNIEVSIKPLQVIGRTLNAPSIMYQNDKIRPRDGSWNIINKKFVDSANIRLWYLLNLATSRRCNMGNMRKFSNKLQEISTNAGIQMNDFDDFKIIDEDYKISKNIDIIFKKIDEIFKDLKNKKYELVVVVIPDTDKKLYDKVKSAAEIEAGIMTQCVSHNTVNVSNASTLSNLCQKINAKKGGTNHTLCKGEIPSRLSEPTLIIGADVSHASVTDKSGISVAAVVGSLDMVMSRFAVSCTLQKNENEKKQSVEKIEKLKDMVKNILLAFLKHTRHKPNKIMFYRDGVSDGQFLEIKKDEVGAIRSACTELEKDYKPAITYVVVQKRHHVQTMPEDPRDGAGRERNVKPGTVIDTDIVHPTNRDFFLYSQFGLKGTSKPAHYTILHDDSDFGPDEFQVFTNCLCYTFSRCTRSISHPVPVRYAHLAAYRTRLHLAQVAEKEDKEIIGITPQLLKKIDIFDNLKNTMYYI